MGLGLLSRFGYLYFLLRRCAAFFTQFGANVRLAHAYRSRPAATDVDDIAEVLTILTGADVLRPRPPANPTAVSAAEGLLGLAPPPVYTFAGCLHPSLGTIGLVIAPQCVPRCLQGVSRCDTGGLAARIGAFAFVPAADLQIAFASLRCQNENWLSAFSYELAISYSTVKAYIAGALPRYDSWNDPRSHCIASHLRSAANAPDRRLWSWEVRLSVAPRFTEYEGIILSPEAFKKLDFLRRSGSEVPEHVKVVRGKVGPTGVHHFDEAATVAALCGRRLS
jgi:hypothetical protein